MDWQGRVRRRREYILEDVPQRRCQALDLEFLERHHGTQQWMGIQYMLTGLKGKEEPRPNFSPASACCWRWCVPSTSEPYTSHGWLGLIQSFPDFSVGGQSQRWRVTVKSIIRTTWAQCYYYLSQKDTVYKVKLQHLKFSSLTESFVHSLNNNLVKESVLDTWSIYSDYNQITPSDFF